MRFEFQECIEVCLECAIACSRCAVSCLQENDIEMMRRCINLDMECETICYAAAKIMSVYGEHANEVCRVCSAICEACAEECERHDTEHCQYCAKICYECSSICKSMVA
jgi:hypothetical protein